MRKQLFRLSVSSFVVILIIIAVSLAFIQKESALAETDVHDFPSEWGVISADVSGDDIEITTNSPWAYKAERTLDGCEGLNPISELPWHQPAEVSYFEYMVQKWDGSWNNGWKDIPRGVQSGWAEEENCSDGDDWDCGYSDCQRTYSINYTIEESVSDLLNSPGGSGEYEISIKVEGFNPSFNESYDDSIRFNIQHPECPPPNGVWTKCTPSDRQYVWDWNDNTSVCAYEQGEDCYDNNRDPYCSGDNLYEDDSYCWTGSCRINNNLITDCNNDDGCIGTTYRDYFCSGGECEYQNYPGDSRCNTAPNTPVLIAPPHNTWINYNPTFKARVTDPDGDNVRAYFTVFEYTSGWGNEVDSGGTSSWGPRNLGNCRTNSWWRARAQDDKGVNSGWSGWWLTKVDKGTPTRSISYPTGTINYTTFTVSLTESDSCSGINQGDVDISINGGAFKDYSSTISNFNYTGANGSSYKFRYRVRDNANNWSGFTEGGTVTIDLNSPPTVTCNDSETFIYCVDSRHPILSWIYSDLDSDPQEFYRVQTDNNSNFSSLISDSNWIDSESVSYATTGINFNWNTRYYWRVRVRDDRGLESAWSSSCNFNTPVHAYPDPDFTWIPNRPLIEENVQFTDQTTYYGGSSGSIWSWTFEDGDPSVSSLENPVTEFNSSGQKAINLIVTDSSGFSCSVSDPINISFPLPKWKEVRP